MAISSYTNNKKLLFFASIVLIYFAWMDIALYMNLQRWVPPLSQYEASNLLVAQRADLDPAGDHHHRYADSRRYSNKTKVEPPFTVFNPLSVKLIMVDHITHYVHDVIARFIEDSLHFSSFFWFVTPNFVSFVGLLLAFIGCSMIALSNNPSQARIGAVLFELRNLADSLDGVVYRSQSRQQRLALQPAKVITVTPPLISLTTEVYQSHYGSIGYNVDMICDGLAGLFFVIAIYIKYSKHLPYLKGYERVIDDEIELLKPSSSSPSVMIPMHQVTRRSIKRHFTSRQVKMIVASFALRLLFTGLLWDHFVHKYHDLLMVLSPNPKKRMQQIQAFKSIGMWLIMWFWRVGNACAILEHLSISTFLNKLWDYLVFTNYIGWGYLILMSIFTQIHYLELYESLNGSLAFT